MASTTIGDHDAALAPAQPAVTEDAFLADRQKFWSWFTGMIVRGVVGLTVLLVLLWFFLVR